MRELWKHDVHWNDPLPNDVNAAWTKWRKQLPEIVKYAIPRYYFRNGAPLVLQLHIFVNASEDAFAAVAYIRSQSMSGEFDVAFVCAKTKCAPIKTLTVPRLELQAAVLGTRLMQCIRDEHSLNIKDCILWSDLKTVIKWIQSEHRRYKPFVQHRIAEILASTSISNWRWIPTKHNVADEATRANDCINFNPTARWSRGPPFLRQNEQAWPSEDITVSGNDEPDEELRPKFALVIVNLQKIVSNVPTEHIKVKKIPENIKLADPSFGVPGKIDLLLGADIFFDLLKEEKISIENVNYKLQNNKKCTMREALTTYKAQVPPALNESSILFSHIIKNRPNSQRNNINTNTNNSQANQALVNNNNTDIQVTNDAPKQNKQNTTNIIQTLPVSTATTDINNSFANNNANNNYNNSANNNIHETNYNTQNFIDSQNTNT
ncbi:putative mediator of RNA polymerase II transcription subunit 26 [Bactrocera dorsalis]|uniref:Mediator of RNA polymerase II transcription subunit 26 n=1 Tax=Bactrocera dorsalis TaxID=27457 RepID=A0ABM3K620_BACDO|nr:putative mediator of RNA polymerase II transcription subunit 26 [Bactrocera dorsalis]